MKPEMSEFSYGFAFTNELITAPSTHVGLPLSFLHCRRRENRVAATT